jgi:hypothetical protein
VGIGAQKLDTIESHPARLREDAQQPDMIAAIPLRSFPMLQRRDGSTLPVMASFHHLLGKRHPVRQCPFNDSSALRHKGPRG